MKVDGFRISLAIIIIVIIKLLYIVLIKLPYLSIMIRNSLITKFKTVKCRYFIVVDRTFGVLAQAIPGVIGSSTYNNNKNYKRFFGNSKIFFNYLFKITILYINVIRFLYDTNKMHVFVLYILNRVLFLKLSLTT